MSWLAKLEIDKETAQKEKIFDSYAWHCKLWECFPGVPNSSRNEIGLLTRVDGLERSFRIWILAKREPSIPSWCAADNFSLKEIAPSFLSHRFYAFDLRANPVKTIEQRSPDGEKLLRADGRKKSGKRIPLVRQEDLRSWIMRKGKVRCLASDGTEVPGGFRIVEDLPLALEISPMMENHFRKRKKQEAAYHGGVQFRGTLEVTDQSAFVETYYSGIGSAKSFGFGLLLLAPINLTSQSA